MTRIFEDNSVDQDELRSVRKFFYTRIGAEEGKFSLTEEKGKIENVKDA